ncbi:MAG: hypothetical protein ACI9S8_001586 [Chlamydiales bacterium]|jgi:hypothetical protein
MRVIKFFLLISLLLSVTACDKKLDKIYGINKPRKSKAPPLDTPFPWKDFEFISKNSLKKKIPIDSIYLLSPEGDELSTKIQQRFIASFKAMGFKYAKSRKEAKFIGVLRLKHSIDSEKVEGYVSRHSYVKYLPDIRTIKYVTLTLDLKIFKKKPNSPKKPLPIWEGMVFNRVRSTWILSEFEDGLVKEKHQFSWTPNELPSHLLKRYTLKDKSEKYSYLELDYYIYTLLRDLGTDSAKKSIKLHPKYFRYASQDPDHLLFQLPE